MARKSATGPTPIIRDRIQRCRKQMKKHGVDAYLIVKPMDYYYLFGFTGEDSAVLLTARDVHVISDGRFDEVINREMPWAQRWMRKLLLNNEVANVCKTLKLKTLTVQGDATTLADHDQLKKLNRSTKLVQGPDIIGEMRQCKDATELTAIRKSIRTAEKAFEALCATIRVGDTEEQLAARLEYEMRQLGAAGRSFPTIVAVGSNAALPHAHPGKRKVAKGSAVLFDWGARQPLYCSDLTRVVFIGSIPPRIAELYDIVLQAQLAAIKAVKPGVRMCDVDKVARDYIAEAGYGKEFGHGLGHGLGLDIHEAPSLSWRSDQPLAEGMVVTVEPGIYLPGVGGVRIEDDIVVTARGCSVLSKLSKQLADAVLPVRS